MCNRKCNVGITQAKKKTTWTACPRSRHLASPQGPTNRVDGCLDTGKPLETRNKVVKTAPTWYPYIFFSPFFSLAILALLPPRVSRDGRVLMFV